MPTSAWWKAFLLKWNRSPRLDFPCPTFPLCTLALLVGLVSASCGEGPSKGGESTDSISPAWWEQTWLAQMAGKPPVADDVVAIAAERWLGASAEAETTEERASARRFVTPASTTLAWRIQEENHRALGYVASLYGLAACRLAQDPGAFGSAFPEGYSAGILWCEAAQKEGEARRIESRFPHLPSLSPPSPPARTTTSTEPSWTSALTPAVERDVALGGESLHFAVHLPSQFVTARGLLQPEPPPAAHEPGGDFLLRLGTSAFVPPGVVGKGLSGAPAIARTPSDILRPWGEIESRTEAELTRFQKSLPSLPLPTGSLQDPTHAALLTRWARRALYRDLGLLLLDGDQPGPSVIALEEAVDTSPPTATDPLLLAALALGRFRTQQWERSAQALRKLGEDPQWEVANALGETLARIAVLPSPSAPGVRR